MGKKRPYEDGESLEISSKFPRPHEGSARLVSFSEYVSQDPYISEAREKLSKATGPKHKVTRGGSSGQTSNQRYSDIFKSEECKIKYDLDFKNRSVIVSRKVHFESIRSLNIENMFKDVGLHNLCTLEGPFYERLIKMFYANFEVSLKPLKVTSFVLGTDIVLTAQKINCLMGIEREESMDTYYNTFKDPYFVKRDDKIELLKKICKDSSINVYYKVLAKDLNIRARVIHHILTYNILPRDGHRDHISCMDLYIMEKVYNRRYFNLGHIILHHMIDVFRCTKKSLPYNLLLSKIFRACGIEIPGSEPPTFLRHVDIYNEHSLTRMGFIRDDQGVWKFKGNSESRPTISGKTVPTDELRGDVEDSDEQDVQMEDVRTRSSTYCSSRSYVEEEISVISEKLDALTTSLLSLRSYFDIRFLQMDALFQHLEHRFEHRFDAIDRQLNHHNSALLRFSNIDVKAEKDCGGDPEVGPS